MSSERPAETVGSLSLSAERRIDGVCIGFEKALQGGQPARIEQFLGTTKEPERSALLQELLRLEVEYRLRTGDRPTVEEYRGRFPEHAAWMGSWYPPRQSAPDGSTWPRLADFEIVAELGRGAMGVVYHARQKSLDRSIAVKMILTGGLADAAAVARFRAEAQTIARLRHPNIVHVHEVGEHNGVPYFTLEYVDGGSLAARLKGPPFSDNEAARLVELLARTLHYAHGQGIVHRDLKPANILLAKDGNPKVADFGLAKMLSDETGATRTGTVMGTASYMAPEAAAGKVREVGPAADVYALGAILYELLTGVPPFCGDSCLEVLRRVEQEGSLRLGRSAGGRSRRLSPRRIGARRSGIGAPVDRRCAARVPVYRDHDAMEQHLDWAGHRQWRGQFGPELFALGGRARPSTLCRLLDREDVDRLRHGLVLPRAIGIAGSADGATTRADLVVFLVQPFSDVLVL
jgi:hypothetical protein